MMMIDSTSTGSYSSNHGNGNSNHAKNTTDRHLAMSRFLDHQIVVSNNRAAYLLLHEDYNKAISDFQLTVRTVEDRIRHASIADHSMEGSYEQDKTTTSPCRHNYDDNQYLECKFWRRGGGDARSASPESCYQQQQQRQRHQKQQYHGDDRNMSVMASTMTSSSSFSNNYNGNNNSSYIFQSVIALCGFDSSKSIPQTFLSNIAIIAHYNLALAYHLSGCNYSQALQHYEISYKLQIKQVHQTMVRPLLAMAILNNIGTIYITLNNQPHASKFFRHLLSTMTFVKETGHSCEVDSWDGFWSNVSTLILRKSVSASAA